MATPSCKKDWGKGSGKIMIGLDQGSANFREGLGGRYFRLCGLISLFFNHSTQPLWHEISPRCYINRGVRLCANTTLFTDTNLDFV